MTYQQKRDELQELFSEKFDAYEKAKHEVSPEDPESENFLNSKTEFEKVNIDFQNFLISFKDNNGLPNAEYGTTGERCDPVNRIQDRF